MTPLNIMCYVIIDLNRDMNIIFDLIYTSAGLFSSIRNLKSFIWYDLRRNLPFNFYLNRKNKNHFFQTCTTKKPLTNNYIKHMHDLPRSLSYYFQMHVSLKN